MQKFIAIGNLCSDPELKETVNGVKVCYFKIAVNRPVTKDGEKKADFFNVTAWRELAERIVQYCKKGFKVCVTGSIQIRDYEDNKGVKRTSVDVIAHEVEFLS